jgi:hypothetical protein
MAERTVMDVRADYYHAGRAGEPDRGGVLGPTAVFTVGTRPVRIAQSNPNRKRAVIENRGTGVVYLSSGSQLSAQFGTGILLRAGETLIDEWPFVHLGEWWAASDASATVAVTEVT